MSPLERLEPSFGEREDVLLEYSARLTGEGVDATERCACWLTGGEARDFTAVAEALVAIEAPPEVRSAQAMAPNPERQGVGVAMRPGAEVEWRLYLHDRQPETQRDDYRAFRWRAGEPPCTSRYQFHFLPRAPESDPPERFAEPALRPGLVALLGDDRVRRASGFWLRTSNGHVDQIDVSLPWSPPSGTLSGVTLLARSLGIGLDAEIAGMHARHVAVPGVGAAPSMTLYASAPRPPWWPTNIAALRAAVRDGAARLHAEVERRFYADLPRLAGDPGGGVAFYDGPVDLWQRVLGPEMHYHAGVFDPGAGVPDDRVLDEAVRRAVRELYPYIPSGGRLYDVGCGWGGPLGMFIRERGCRALGLTPSAVQFQRISALGWPVRWGDAEETLPPGVFDCVVLLESFSHIRDKARLLRILRPFARRLVMRVNCQDGAPPSTNFGGSMHMISSTTLREMLVQTGWQVQRFVDRRLETLPTVAGWHRRLETIAPQSDPHIETLRAWCARVVPQSEAWGRLNPLIEVVAD